MLSPQPAASDFGLFTRPFTRRAWQAVGAMTGLIMAAAAGLLAAAALQVCIQCMHALFTNLIYWVDFNGLDIYYTGTVRLLK